MAQLMSRQHLLVAQRFLQVIDREVLQVDVREGEDEDMHLLHPSELL
jgi:hypothetical protein